jgi:hypothetical protein
MTYEVRQLSFGEILDESFRVLKDQFVVLVGITALLYVPFSVVSALLAPAEEAGVPTLASLGRTLVPTLVMLCVMPLTQLALTQAVASAYLSAPITLDVAYGEAVRLFTRYLGTLLLLGLALLGLGLLLVLPAVYFGVCWTLVGPVLVIEGLTGREAMRRSRALTRGYWWRTLGVTFVIGLISMIVGVAVQAVVGSIPVLGPALSGAVQAVTTAFGAVALVVLYVDLRCRVEDFDLQRLAAEVKGVVAAPDPQAPATGP